MVQQPPSPRPLRVLVVEDRDDAREALRVLIGLWGHDCEAAPAGPAAVQVGVDFAPDVVLMDIGLPGRMDGYECAFAMRKLPRLAGTSFVAMTGGGREEDRERSRTAGFVSHLVKPVAPARLREMLASFAAYCAGLAG